MRQYVGVEVEITFQDHVGPAAVAWLGAQPR
jgi:hypothetical protein